MGIKVARECYNIHNFTTLIEIIYGLSHNSIYRLKENTNEKGGLFRTMSKKLRNCYDKLLLLASPADNYKVYRHIMKQSKEIACIPYLGVMLKDLVAIQELGQPLKICV